MIRSKKGGKEEGIRENEISRGAHETVGLNVGQLSKMKYSSSLIILFEANKNMLKSIVFYYKFLICMGLQSIQIQKK